MDLKQKLTWSSNCTLELSFPPKSNTVITGKGKEHTEDSERLGIDTWKKDGGKETEKKNQT